MIAEATKEHQWLQRLVGDWVYEHEAMDAAQNSAEQCSGSETVEMLGNLWVIARGTMMMPGNITGAMLVTIGYDPQKKKFVGTWIGSMMSYLWMYEGELSEDGSTLTLSAEGPNCGIDMAEGAAPGLLVQYRDVIQVHDDNYRTLTSHMQLPSGEWHRFMVAHYRRKVS